MDMKTATTRIIGIDPSLTRTGIALLRLAPDGEIWHAAPYSVRVKKKPAKRERADDSTHDLARFYALASVVTGTIVQIANGEWGASGDRIDRIVLEDPRDGGYSGKTSRQTLTAVGGAFAACAIGARRACDKLVELNCVDYGNRPDVVAHGTRAWMPKVARNPARPRGQQRTMKHAEIVEWVRRMSPLFDTDEWKDDEIMAAGVALFDWAEHVSRETPVPA